MYWNNKNLTSIFNLTRASNIEYTGHFILRWPIYKSGSDATILFRCSVIYGCSNSPRWNIVKTCYDSILPFLGQQGMKIEAYHGVCPVHTDGQVSNYSNASSWRSPQHLTAPPNRISSIVLLNMPTSPGRQVSISNSEKSMSRLAAVLWRQIKSNSAPLF